MAAERFRLFIKQTREIYVTSRDAADRQEFVRLGLSDAVLLEVAKQDLFILSADLDLYLAAAAAGYQVANFNHHIEAAKAIR